MVNLKKFKENNIKYCNNFNKVLDLYHRAITYLESKCPQNEIDKYVPLVDEYTRKLSLLMHEFKEKTDEDMPERIIEGGFILYDEYYKD